jgi:hypothetical protein
MIGDATHDLGNSVRGADDSTEVCMEVATPSRLNHRLVILRTENDVIMQAQMRRWHGDRTYLLRPYQGSGCFYTRLPVVYTTS